MRIFTFLLLATVMPIGQAQSPVNDLPEPRVGFSPPRFELKWDGTGSTESLVVLNTSGQPLGVAVTVVNWDLDEDNKTRTIAPTEQSLDQWMIINPLQFSIEPNSQQTVRFAIRPRIEPTPGEHRAMIFLEEKPLEREADDEKMSINFRFGLPVYLQVGEADRSGEINGMHLVKSPQFVALALDFTNTGNAYARLQGSYAIWPEAQYPGDSAAADILESLVDKDNEEQEQQLSFDILPGSVVLPGYQRTLQIPVSLPEVAGDFVMVVSGSIGDAPLWRTLRFSRTALN